MMASAIELNLMLVSMIVVMTTWLHDAVCRDTYCLYDTYPEFGHAKCTTNAGQTSLLQCSRLCCVINSCVGFYYDTVEMKCLHIDVLAESTCSDVSGVAWQVYKKRSGIGECSRYRMNGVPDEQITASSDNNAAHPGYDLRPHHARLNSVAFVDADGLQIVGAWMAIGVGNEWIQVQFNTKTIIHGIATQGRYYNEDAWESVYDQRVTKYHIEYSMDCSTWNQMTYANGTIKMFDGNLDGYGNNIHTNILKIPVVALCVRLYVEEYVWLISLRLDFLGCPYIVDE